MKNQQVSLKESVATEASYFTEIKQNQNLVLCTFNNIATLACQNKKCNAKGFLCSDKQCQCKKEHHKCLKINLDSLIENVESKHFFVDSLETCINNGIDEIIDLLSKYRDQKIKTLKKDFEFFGLNENEKVLMKEIKNGKCEKTTGKTIWEIIHSQIQKQNIMKIIEQTCKSLQNNFKKAKQSFQSTVKETETTFDSMNSQMERFSFASGVSNYLKQNNQCLIIREIDLAFSKIMTSLKQFSMITIFFAPKIIKSAKLFYRASENNFQLTKFHQKCDGVPDTLTLVETEFGKKIGGYTPIKWTNNQNCVYVKDESMTSFLFSLTNGDKFHLTNKDQAVCHYPSYGPTFGGGFDLYICDKANQNNSSYARINNSYKNEKYQCDQKSWERFSGATSSQYFKVKQWQVWSLSFN